MLVAESQELVRWYDEKVRPFFQGYLEEDKVRAFDKDRDRLKRVTEQADIELAVCFLGNSGVGKSTLINAIIGGSQSIVPSGGVGPLTAQALVVRHGPQTRFRVEYHSAGELLRTVFGLEQMFRAELGAPVAIHDDLEGAEELEEQDLVQQESVALDPDDDGACAPEVSGSKRDNWRRRAQLLITGGQDQDRDLKYLLDSMREAAGGKRRWGTAAEGRDAERVRAIQYALALAKKKLPLVATGGIDGTFRKALQDHATGFLAPLIKSLELQWDTDVLRHGITLVDLPGVGVMRDVHRDVTRYWIREKANALVLIVDHRGLHDSVAESLRQSEFLNSLLYSADEPEDDPVVMVAVTRIDDIANERYKQDKSRKKAEHFADVVAEAEDKLRHEMQRSLRDLWLKGEDVPPSRLKVVQNLLATLQVHPLSAPEYSRLIAEDDDDRSFLRNPDQSGIPKFRASLIEMANQRREKGLARLGQEASLFREQVTTNLRLIQSQWESDARADEEVQKLKEDLELFLLPRRKELHGRQGGYRTFLKTTIPQRIEDLVETASLKAKSQINRYMNKLGSAHWATLRASVKRGGRYSGSSDINLPSEFALKFEEPIAEVWGKEILASIRKETRDYANDCVAMVEEVAAWALDQGARVQPKVVEAQRDAIKADAKKLETVGREMVKEMRDDAKAQLINRIEGPIKNRCESFIRKNLHVGPGVKNRILDLYSGMADEVTETAKDPATKILQKLFREVEKEILDVFKGHEDPLEAVAEAIVASQESHMKRSDAQKKRRILEHLDEVFATTPARNVMAAAASRR